MDKTADSVREASLKMAGGSQHVLEEMGKLRESVEAVRFSMAAMSENAQSVAKNGMRLDECVAELSDNICKLESDVKLFRTN